MYFKGYYNNGVVLELDFGLGSLLKTAGDGKGLACVFKVILKSGFPCHRF